MGSPPVYTWRFYAIFGGSLLDLAGRRIIPLQPVTGEKVERKKDVWMVNDMYNSLLIVNSKYRY